MRGKGEGGGKRSTLEGRPVKCRHESNPYVGEIKLKGDCTLFFPLFLYGDQILLGSKFTFRAV